VRGKTVLEPSMPTESTEPPPHPAIDRTSTDARATPIHPGRRRRNASGGEAEGSVDIAGGRVVEEVAAEKRVNFNARDEQGKPLFNNCIFEVASPVPGKGGYSFIR
jgi:hypothetical protein